MNKHVVQNVCIFWLYNSMLWNESMLKLLKKHTFFNQLSFKMICIVYKYEYMGGIYNNNQQVSINSFYQKIIALPVFTQKYSVKYHLSINAINAFM